MLIMKKNLRYIIFAIISFLLLFLLRNIYAADFDIEGLVKIIFLDFADFEKLALVKFNLPYIAAFLIVTCFIFNYVSMQFVKLNNSYYLIRFSSRQSYIIYFLKNVYKEVFKFLFIWVILVLGFLYIIFNRISIYIFVICLLNIVKMTVMICIIFCLYTLFILRGKRNNLGILLIILFMIFCVDLILETHCLTMGSDIGVSLIYIFVETIILFGLNYIIIKHFNMEKEIGGSYD